jgi:hypothetical protein
MAKLEALLTSHTAYPLFDDDTGGLVEAGIATGLIAPLGGALDRGKQVGAATAHMYELPAFPGASVSEVIDIRVELLEPLVRFRTGVQEIADDIEADLLNDSFEEEVHEQYVAKVAPAVQEIRELIQQNRYLRQLLREVVTDGKTVLTGLLTLGVATIAHIPALIAAGAAAGQAAAEAAVRARQARDAARQRHFYILYRVQESLAEEEP